MLNRSAAMVVLLLAGAVAGCSVDRTVASAAADVSGVHVQKAANERSPHREPGKGVPSKPGHASERADEIVRQVMDRQYGGFDPALGCWRYTSANGGEYCMKPSEAHTVTTDAGSRLYFLATNRSDIGAEYRYSHVDAGLMGAFVIEVGSPSGWSPLAASKDMEFGSVGDCGCEEARFARLGRDYYGWIFVSGGVWQGVASLYHGIVAPEGREFVDLSEIPAKEESRQDVEFLIQIDDSDADKPVYPLLVTRVEDGYGSEVLKVDFDLFRRRYLLPEKWRGKQP